jgi:cysteine-S-conjugate beta-lyase
MKYNFDEVIPRRNSNSFKWDAAKMEGVLPMWVADMDFRAAPPILEALTKRVQHGIFGYAKVPPAYFDAVTGWFGSRYQFNFNKDWILPTTGVVPALSAIISAFTERGDKVIIQSPVYNHFFSSIENNEREWLSNDLIYKDGTYTIDFNDLEKKAADPKATLFILCHPHNPAGRAWTKNELTAIGEICIRHNVLIVSDEIHCDLVYAPHQHIPFGSIHPDFLHHSITCISPSKSFNLAGIQVANLLAADDTIRRKLKKALTKNEIALISPFAVDALIAAYSESEEWLEALKQYLYDNYLYLKNFFAQYLPQLPVITLEATYLVWVDCSALHQSSKAIADLLLENEKLWVNAGTLYGPGGEGFMRLNIACSRQLLVEGLNKIKNSLGGFLP